MVRERIANYRDLVRRQLVAAFQEERTPRQVAASFAIGIFVTAMPTGGLGIGLFFVFISLWSWISKPAIFASVAVLNPFVKPAVYLASFQVGGLVLGSGSIRSREATTTESAWVAIQQLLIGNVLIAILLSVLGYVVVLYLTRIHRRQADSESIVAGLASLVNPFRRQ